MDGVGGLEILAKAKRELPDAEVVILTGHGTITTAVTAMQQGRLNYLTKPLDIGELRAVVRQGVADRSGSRRANLELQRRLDEKFGFEGVIGNSPPMHAVIDRLRQIAPTDATRADHRRERHRQGAGRQGHPQQQPAARTSRSSP